MPITRELKLIFFFSSRRRHTRFSRDWSSDVCSSDLRCKGAGPRGRRELQPVEPRPCSDRPDGRLLHARAAGGRDRKSVVSRKSVDLGGGCNTEIIDKHTVTNLEYV